VTLLSLETRDLLLSLETRDLLLSLETRDLLLSLETRDLGEVWVEDVGVNTDDVDVPVGNHSDVDEVDEVDETFFGKLLVLVL
jgi:hypothetical protein